MIQRKKLEYYAKQCGIEHFDKIKLTEEECEKICMKVGVPTVHARDIGGSFGTLISVVMDRPEFIESHRKPEIPEDILLIRCGDYAAMEVFKAYSEQ